MNIVILSLLLLCTLSAHAVKISLEQRRSIASSRRSGNGAVSFHRPGNVLATSDSNDIDVDNVHDLIYIANVTVGGTEYPVQLDTGSSDLWIQGATFPLPNSISSPVQQNLTYGRGWAFGNVSYAPAEFAGVSINNQSFIDTTSAESPALGYGALGILGLGFTSLSSVDALLNKSGSAAGRSVLFNAFLDNPSEPNFISFALPREADPGNDVTGAVTIGEYVEKYKSIADTTPISTWPVDSPRRWNVLLDAILIGGKTIPVTTVVSGAPSNKAVVLLDTGTTLTYAPPEVCSAIYSGVSGAKYDSIAGAWFVPCNVEIDLALQINNQAYPIHPLDVTPYNYPSNDTCVGSFIPQAVSVGTGEFDWLVGDNVLRSIYSVYDFGDIDSSGKMGSPFVRLLPIVDPNAASADFAAVRGSTAHTNITYNVTPMANGASSVSSSDDLTTTLNKLNTYIPAMLAIMAFNALVVLALIVFGIVYLCRRRRVSTARKNRGRASPMPLNTISTGNYRESASSQPHTYEPVSMALTEDTFVPHSPQFRKGNMAGKRPDSYQSIGVVRSDADDSFVPPSPAFFRTDDSLRVSSATGDNRPKSVA